MSSRICGWEKKKLLKKFGSKCWYCGTALNSENTHLDHIVPRSKQGPNIVENLSLSCGTCNISKMTVSVREFLDRVKHIEGDKSKCREEYLLKTERKILRIMNNEDKMNEIHYKREKEKLRRKRNMHEEKLDYMIPLE